MKAVKVPLVIPLTPEPVMWHVNPDRHVGAINEKLQEDVSSFAESSECPISKERMDLLMSNIYSKSMASPGENVGTIGAQGIGEPSTQMTLNTFHLAGHGGANVTLGIPRLREVLMTASQDIKTPSMVIPLLTKSKEDAERVKRKLARATLQDLVRGKGGISVSEVVERKKGSWVRNYTITLTMHEMGLIKTEFNLDLKKITEKVVIHFVKILSQVIKSACRSQNKNDAQALENAQLEGLTPTKEKTLARDASKAKGSSGEPESEEEDEYDSDEADKKEIEGYDDGEEEVDDSSTAEGETSDSDDAMDEDGAEGDDDESAGEMDIEEVQTRSPSQGVKVPFLSTAWSKFIECRRFEENGADHPARIQIKFEDSASNKPLLMIDHARDAAEKTVICETKSITGCYVVEEDEGGYGVQTDGCNIDALRQMLDLIDANKVKFNDVGVMLRNYGVEAARACIVQEISRVFNAYGISVDPRHLGLVADYMTFEGQYRPLNRIGMEGNTSPFLRMTFETSSKFLVNASLFGEVDTLESPAAQIVMGQLVRGGTGICDVFLDVSNKSSGDSSASGASPSAGNFREKRHRARSQSSIDFDVGGVLWLAQRK